MWRRASALPKSQGKTGIAPERSSATRLRELDYSQAPPRIGITSLQTHALTEVSVTRMLQR